MAKTPVRRPKLGLLGSRNFERQDLVAFSLSQLTPSILVTGDSVVGQWAVQAASKLRWPDPYWVTLDAKKKGKAVLDCIAKVIALVDGLIVFWDGESMEMKSAIRMAAARQIPLIVVKVVGDQITVADENWSNYDDGKGTRTARKSPVCVPSSGG